MIRWDEIRWDDTQSDRLTLDHNPKARSLERKPARLSVLLAVVAGLSVGFVAVMVAVVVMSP